MNVAARRDGPNERDLKSLHRSHGIFRSSLKLPTVARMREDVGNSESLVFVVRCEAEYKAEKQSAIKDGLLNSRRNDRAILSGSDRKRERPAERTQFEAN